MKKFLIGLIFIWGTSCNKGDITELPQTTVSYFKHTYKLRKDSISYAYIEEYDFDNQGRVVSETYMNVYNLDHNFSSKFEYNEHGQVIKEVRNGQTFYNVSWTDNIAKVYNPRNSNVNEFRFEDEKLIEIKLGDNLRKFNYDANDNIVAVEDKEGILVEYLEYDSTVVNPFNLINSIGILRWQDDYKPFFKNVYGVEKIHPYYGEDFYFPLSHYNYYYSLDTANRVIESENEKRSIYKQEFIYR